MHSSLIQTYFSSSNTFFSLSNCFFSDFKSSLSFLIDFFLVLNVLIHCLFLFQVAIHPLISQRYTIPYWDMRMHTTYYHGHIHKMHQILVVMRQELDLVVLGMMQIGLESTLDRNRMSYQTPAV